MKKLFLIPLMLLASLMMATACSADEPAADGHEQTTPGEDGGEEGNEGSEDGDEGGNVDGTNGRYLVLYCSRTGNTESMAQTIQSTLDCDMIEVVPETPYDDNYNTMLERARTELAAIGQGTYPAIATSVESFEDYDIVFVGYPVWHGHMATPMQSFLHSHADLLAGKRIALFASSVSSLISTSERDAASLVPDATLAENSSAEALKALLAEGDLTIEMSDYGNMEKVGRIGQSLPRNDEHITTSPGDLILYQGSNLVIYYATNTYTLTRLGRIDNVEEDELRTALGEGSVTVTLSLDNNE